MPSTYSRRANTALMVVILVVVAAALVALALTQPTVAEAQQPPVEQAPVVHVVETPELDPFIVELVGPGVDLDEQQVHDLLEARDLSCEGFTAGVPIATMTTVLMHDYDLTGPESRDLVNLAGTTYCNG